MKPAKFKMTELGPIPSDWEVKRLGEVWKSFRTGPFGSTLHSNDYVENGIPIVNPMHIDNGRIIPTTEMCVSHSTAKRLSAYRLSVDDIVIGRRGEMGRAALITTNEKGWLCGTGCFFFHLNNNVCPDYVARYLRTTECASRLEEEAVGTTLINLNQTILGNVLLPLPPLPEQHRIAAALSDVDELIGALGKLVEKKRAIKTGAMQRLLTGQTRLPGFGGTGFKQTELGPIPSDWEVKRLGETFSMLRNNTYARESLTDDGGKVFNVHYGDILVKYGAIVNFEMDEVPCLKAGIKPNKDMLQDGDLIFADTAEDEMVGKAVEVAGVNGRQAVAGLHTILCRPYSDTFAHGFLGYFVNSAAYHNQLLPLITGTKVSSVSRAGFASTYVCIPSLPEQRAIAAVLSDMDAEIAALEAEKRKVEAIKQGMMQELLTGRTRLMEASSED